jgi:hypothetical protein
VPSVQDQKISHKSAANYKPPSMYAPNLRSTTSSIKTNQKANGNSPSMLSSHDSMPTVNGVMIYYISPPPSCNSINSKEFNLEAPREKHSQTLSNKYQNSSKKQWKISERYPTILWISTKRNSMKTF